MPGRGARHNVNLCKTLAKALGTPQELILEREEGAMSIHH